MTMENNTASDLFNSVRDKRYSVGWGLEVAESLWNSYKAMGADFIGKRVLDFGCGWGYMCMLCLEKGASFCVGVDITPHWEKLEDPSFLDRDDLHLICGDLLVAEELQSMSFDVILSSGTLFLLDSTYLDNILDWFYDHLVPGGVAFLRTRCVTAKSFNDLGTRLSVPGAQLLFSRRVVNKVLSHKGFQECKNHLGYTGATWIMACHCAGFEVVNVYRHSNTDVVTTAATHAAKLRWINPLELGTSEITLHLQKPFRQPDLTGLRMLG